MENNYDDDECKKMIKDRRAHINRSNNIPN